MTANRTVVLMLLVLAAVLLIAGDLLQLANAGLAWTALLALAFTAFAAGLLLLPEVLAARAEPLMVVGSIVAFLGSIAGASMQAMFRVQEVLQQTSQDEALRALENHRGLTLTTLAPGLLFPLGLLLLSVALFRRGSIPAAFALALGAVLFPIGHAVGLPLALIGGDVVLLCAFVLLATTRRQAAA